MIIISIRIIITWFNWAGRGGLVDILSKITDPYLNWFRRFPFLKVGSIDLSPIAALGVLSVLSRVLGILAQYGRITIGIILALVLQAVWGIAAFFIGFLVVILVLRFIALITGQSNYTPFWRIIDAISQPVLYRINRLLFKDRIPNFKTAIGVSIGGLVLSYIVLRILVSVISGVLFRLPF
jgi:YggT family protein